MRTWARALLALLVVLVLGAGSATHVQAFVQAASSKCSSEMRVPGSTAPTVVHGAGCTTTAESRDVRYDVPITTRVDAYRIAATDAGPGLFSDARDGSAARPAESSGASTTSPALSNATNLADDAAGVAFRTDTSHIFRNATGHLAEDTAANRALIRSAVEPASLRSTISLPDGSTLERYFRTLPDGTQVWAEVRNGIEITNGGLSAVPR